MNKRLIFILVSTIVILWSIPSFAQQETATVSGEIRDATGAVVPKAAVTLTNVETGMLSRSESNERGIYTVPLLKPGLYSLTVEKQGFNKYVQSGIILQVNSNPGIDVELKVGEISTVVEITAGAPLLETESSSRGQVIDQKKIVDLPLNGRDYNQLALLSPGVLPGTPRLASVNFKGVLNVNGNRTFNNVFLLDGVDNISYSNSFRGENVQVIQPSIEALQEFKIQTNAYSAEFGRSSGAVVNATIKSGTNKIHGAVYEFHRNEALDANNFFLNTTGDPKPRRLRNQFGGAVGGPIIKNKTFWFGDYEGLRDREGVPRTRLVPTAAEKAGLFSTAVVDPFAAGRPAFSQNAAGQWVIPSSRWDPVGAKIVGFIPDPNAVINGQPVYISAPVTKTRQDQFDARLDHQFAPNLTLFGRYSFVDTNTFRPGPLPGLAEGSFNDAFGANENRSQGFAVGLTWTFSPSLIGDFRLGWTRGNYFTYPPNFGVDGPGQVGLLNVPDDPAIAGGLPKINIQGFDAVGRHTSTPQFQTPRAWNPRATINWNRGLHLFKFGGEFLKVQTRINDLNATIGRMNFENRFTGRAVGDLLLGLPSQLALTSFTVMDQGQNMQFYFFQDDYKVNSKLTLNIGVRYEYATPPIEKDNQFANFDPRTGTMAFAKDGSIYDRALIHPDRNNLAPRFGFAYSPTSRWVFRGAYGIFYTHTVRQGREGLLGFNPPFLVDNLLQVSGSANVASAAPFRLVSGYPSGLLDPTSLSPTISRRSQDPFQRSPYIQQYNFGMQYELVKDLLLDVAYVGNKGTKLNGFRNLNQIAVIDNADGSQRAGARPFPAFGDIQWMENRVNSSYHSLQTRLEKRFSSGLTGMISYTWGKALTGAPDHISTSGGGAGFDTGTFREPQDGNNLRAERGLAEFDIKHRFVASYVYELPFGKGRRWGNNWNSPANLILGGWQLTGIHVVQSGLGLTATLGGSSVLGLGGERRARPNLVGDPELPDSERTIARWFNTSAFAAFNAPPLPSSFQRAFGNAGVGIMRGPGLVNFDFTMAKNFNLSERNYFQFRTEFFNAFNRANFGPPNIARDSGGFGTILTAGNARIIQFGLKYYF